MSALVEHNVSAKRFEIHVDGFTAYVSYVPKNSLIVFDHTYVPQELRGRKLAHILAEASLNTALKEQWKIIPECSFIADYIRHNPKYSKLVFSGIF